jgi:hypothetical protein
MPPKKSRKPLKVIVAPSAYDSYFEVKAVPGKGNALYAKQALAPNTRIAYEGKIIDQKEYDRLLKLDQKDPPTQYMAYIIAGGRKGRYIDAHKRYPSSDAWIASKANEPDTGKTANMVMTGGLTPSLVTVRAIKKGEQLTVCYGSNYKRVGYRKGKCPRKPTWV